MQSINAENDTIDKREKDDIESKVETKDEITLTPQTLPGESDTSEKKETKILKPQPVTKKSTGSNVVKDEKDETSKRHGSITIEEMGFSFEGPDNPSGVTIKKFNVNTFAKR